MRQNPYVRRVLQSLGTDFLLVGCTLFATWQYGVDHRVEWSTAVRLAAITCAVPILALAIVGRYDPTACVRRREVLGAALAGALIGWLAATAAGGLDTAELAALFALVSSTTCLASHAFIGTILAPRRQRVLLVGASDLAYAIAREIRERAGLRLQVVGLLSDAEEPDAVDEHEDADEVPALGPVHHLEKVVDELNIDRIVVASKDRAEYFPADELLTYKTRGRIVESGVAFYEGLTGKIYIRNLRPSYLVFSDGFRASVVARAVKRGIDVALATIGLVVASPVLAVCALAIKLDSRGPVLFRQVRVGRFGKAFGVIKLRTMRRDAEAESGPALAHRRDARVTRIGRVLRQTRLDEVPQLWNVLRGDMTLVGPRPERPEFVGSLIRDFGYFRLRTTMRPGLTGWAQVNNGYAAESRDFEEKLSYDLFYLKHRSLGLDFVVLLRTIREVLLFKGV